MLMFGLERLLNFLACCNTWCSDGIFLSCPCDFAQLYTIGGVKCDFFLSCVFALVTNKKRKTYAKLLDNEDHKVSNCKMLFDFEVVAW